MSMYLPNPDLRPTGFEMTEFIDVRPMGETATAVDRPPGPRHGPTVRLDPQTRLDIARRAAKYIAGLVEDHNGDPADVRFVIHELQGQSPVAHHDGSAVDGPSSRSSGPGTR